MYNLFIHYRHKPYGYQLNITVTTTTYMQIIPEIRVNHSYHSVLWT